MPPWMHQSFLISLTFFLASHCSFATLQELWQRSPMCFRLREKGLLIFRHQETISAKCSPFLPCYSRCRFGVRGNGLYIQHNCLFLKKNCRLSLSAWYFFCEGIFLQIIQLIDDLFLQIISFAGCVCDQSGPCLICPTLQNRVDLFLDISKIFHD